MWIGSHATKILLIISALVLTSNPVRAESKIAKVEPETAWWLRVEFQPISEVVHGIDIRAIDDTWRYALELNTQIIKNHISTHEANLFMEVPLSFTIVANVGGAGVLHEFFVGVYESVEGTFGRFVVINQNGDAIQHFTDEGTAGFSALRMEDGEIHWYKCMQCGEYDVITWTGHNFVLR